MKNTILAISLFAALVASATDEWSAPLVRVSAVSGDTVYTNDVDKAYVDTHDTAIASSATNYTDGVVGSLDNRVSSGIDALSNSVCRIITYPVSTWTVGKYCDTNGIQRIYGDTSSSNQMASIVISVPRSKNFSSVVLKTRCPTTSSNIPNCGWRFTDNTVSNFWTGTKREDLDFEIPANAKELFLTDYIANTDHSPCYVAFKSDFYTREVVNLLDSRVRILEGTKRTYAAIGDSITAGGSMSEAYKIPEGDTYEPFAATVPALRRKIYAYYIAKKLNLKWANYGKGGATLTRVPSKVRGSTIEAINSFQDRIDDMANEDWDFITILFGVNDQYFGPFHWRDKWLYDEYHAEIGYPDQPSKIDTEGWTTAAQKAACDEVEGYVDDVYYDNADDYFMAQFLGNTNSTDVTTWCGAMNHTIETFMLRHPNAKIMVIEPFGSPKQPIKTALKNVADKWGVQVFSFADVPYWFNTGNKNETTFENPDTQDGNWYTVNGTKCEKTINGFNASRFSVDIVHPSHLGYKRMAEEIGKVFE